MANNTPVTVLGGPEAHQNYLWWYVRTANGQKGWVVECVGGLQTLVINARAPSPGCL